MEKEIEFKTCSTCKGKIGFFRRRAARKKDQKGESPVLQAQFCSDKCAKIGQLIYLEFNDIRAEERDRIIKLINSALNMIERKRNNIINKYGSIDKIPQSELALLYSGGYNLLQIIKEKIQHGNEKE